MENGLRHPPFLPYLVLLRVGFAMPRALLRERCALTAPFHPYRDFNSRAPQRLAPASPSRPVRAERLSPFGSPGRRRYIFCGTFRKVSLNSPSRTLSGTLLCGVRTFLSLDRAARETPASTSQTATIRFDISYPYYKMNLGSKGFRFPGQRLCLIAKANLPRNAETRRRRQTPNSAWSPALPELPDC
jgi:hypothetical protein